MAKRERRRGAPLPEAQRIALAVARSYRRRVWWAEVEDLEQEAALAIEQARRTFNASVGVPFGAYAARAAHFAVRRFLWAQSAPVSGSNLGGLRRAALDAQLVSSAPGPDALHEHAEWRERVNADARAALAPFFSTTVTDRVIAIISGFVSSRDAATRDGVPVKQVYAETALARAALASDAALWQTWKDL